MALFTINRFRESRIFSA